MPTRPAPRPVVAKPPVAPRPVAPKPPVAKPVAPKPVAQAPRATKPPVTKPPKPTTNPGPGRSWVYNAKTNSWDAKEKAVVVKDRPTSGTYVPGKGTVPAPSGVSGDAGVQGIVDQVDSGGVDSGTDATAEQTKAAITNAALGKVSEQDPLLRQQYTQGIGKLGFGFGKAGGGLAGFEDIFGAFTPGGTANTAGLTIRDALGREVSAANAQALLGSNVYDQGGAAQNIAGTSLGDLILASRRGAARAAEERSAGGLSTSGGFRSAAGESERIGRESDITGLLSQLTGLTSDISGKRQGAYSGALGDITTQDISGYVPAPAKTAPSPAAAAAAGAAPSGKPQLTAGPGGTFRSTTDKILSGGTPKQKVAKLNALLNTKSLTPVQVKTVKQMIVNQKKKK